MLLITSEAHKAGSEDQPTFCTGWGSKKRRMDSTAATVAESAIIAAMNSPARSSAGESRRCRSGSLPADEEEGNPKRHGREGVGEVMDSIGPAAPRSH